MSKGLNFYVNEILNKPYLFIFVAVILCFTSCKSNVEQTYSIDIEQADLEGRWTMVHATRNGNKTELLDNSFIEFTKAEAKHNFLGDSTPFSYSYANQVFESTDDLLKEGKIVRLTADTLELQTRYQNFLFEFVLSRI